MENTSTNLGPVPFPAPPEANPASPEETALPPEETPTLPSLAPTLRILGSIVLFLGGLAGLAFGALLALGTILSLPQFLYLGLEHPFTSLISTIGYLATIACFITIGLFAGRLAYNLIRKQEITRKILITCGITFAMALACLFLVLPAAAAPFKSPTNTPQTHFSNPLIEEATSDND